MIRIIRCCLSVLLPALLCLSLPSAAEQHGQVKFGGLGVPGVTVTVTQGDKTLTVLTDGDGTYSFPDLPDGTWNFKVEMLCFTPIAQAANITAGLPAPDWDLKLLPMSEIQAAAGPAAPPPPSSVISQTTTQTAAPTAAPAKNAKNNKKGATPATPQTGFQKTDVTASAAPPVTNAVPPPPPSDAFANQSPSELSARSNDGFLIQGSANNGASTPFSQSNAFGNNRRGLRSLYTGNVSFAIDNSALDARPFSVTGQETPKSAQQRFQGGFALSGPLRIPHLLRNGPTFFLNYQWNRARSASNISTTVPSLAERAGDFTSALNGFGLQQKVSPQALALLNYYPLPNFDGNSAYNYQSSLVSHSNTNSLQSRANKSIGRKDTVDGLFAFTSVGSQTVNLFHFPDSTSTLGMNAIANWRHRFTSRTILHFQEQFSRQSVDTVPYFANLTNVSGNAGIAGNNQEPINWGPPSLTFSSGIAGLNDGNSSQTHAQTQALAFDGLWYRTPHSLTYGVDYKRIELNSIAQANPRGSFTFTGAATGNDFADFLYGIPDTTQLATGNADKYYRSQSYDAWIDDDWRISPSFTLKVGLRWEYSAPFTELYGRLVNLAVGTNFSTATPVLAGNSSNSLLKPDLHEFQPRVGFSWRPFPASSMVVRGGYGVYYNTSVYQSIASQLAIQPPFSKTLSIPNTPTNSITLADAFNATPTTTTANTFGIDPNFRVGYAQNWNLSVQRDLPQGLVMTATYLGIKGTRAVQDFLPNTYPIGGVSPCPGCPVGYNYMTSNGNSHREAGEIQLRRRLHSGFTATLDYTYAKAIDDASILGGRGSAFGAVAQNWQDLSAERGLSTFDQRHVLTASAQYTTGMGIGGGTLLDGWRGRFFKEWNLLVQANAATGTPLTPTILETVPGTGDVGSLRAQYTGAPVYSTTPGLFLNPAAFTLPPAGQFGNAGRDTITGPFQLTLNASALRTFRLTDRFNMDFQVQATNALNHVVFPNWNTVVDSPQYGLGTNANAMRSILTTFRVRF